MSDIKKDPDPNLTRPSKPAGPPDDADKTRLTRPPEDFQPTVPSQRQRPPSTTPISNTPADSDSTQIHRQSTGYQPARRQPARPTVVRPSKQPPRTQRPTVVATPQKPKRRPINWWRLFVRSLALLSLIVLLLAVLGLSASVIGYFWIARQLPSADELRARSFQFETTEILDKEGNLLWEIIDPSGGRRTWVPVEQISPQLINATIATEDRFFYLNVGVDPIAIGRAVYYNVTEGEIVSGASTITQQLARNVLLTPEERTEQSLTRKVKEAILAVEINRRYTKDQILEVYLNQIYYGNLAYGIEAASQTYFGKSASDLTLAEASLLAGLPQSPAVHDPYVNPDGAAARQADVLSLMIEAGYINAAEAEVAKREGLNVRQLNAAFEAPHFVTYARQELESIFPPELIYQAGLRIQTTLDPRLQAIAEEEVANHVDSLAGNNVSNGALVALDVDTGHILALVGSKDFRDETISGQVNMATSPRQPGSTIKPLTYLTTFEQLGWTPSTLFMDVPVEYADGAGGVYTPNNYDEKFHGPVSLRIALANSYNIPPVKALEAVGVDALKEMAARLGITTLTRNDYGLSLTLGSGEVPLVEMTGAYQAMANNGRLVSPTSILQVTDSFGRVIWTAQPQARRVLRQEHAYLITNIMADNEARSISFGPNSYLRLSRPAAAKTGTTNDFRDNWTIGYTPDIVAGVWVGNADRRPMINVTGLTGAGPIWHNFMERAHEGLAVRDFPRPATIIELEVCADSGTIPSELCPERRKEIFFRDQPPLGPEFDIHQLIEIDRNTGMRANEFCRTNIEEHYFRVYPPDGREWAIEHGFEQPPDGYCPSSNIVANISQPLDGSTVRGTLTLEGSVAAANFSHYQIELGQGTNPQSFVVIQEPTTTLIEQGFLGSFDSTKVENGPYTLRVVVFDQTGGAVETRVHVLVNNPIATATPIPTATSTLTPTPVPPTAEPTIEPTIEPTVEPTIEPTVEPTTEIPIPPTVKPTAKPLPTEKPTTEIPIPPTQEPTVEPTAEPTVQPDDTSTP